VTASKIRTLFITQRVPYGSTDGASLRNLQNINIMMNYGPVAVFSATNWSPTHASLPGVALWEHANIATQLSLAEKLERQVWWLRRRAHPGTDRPYSNTAGRKLDELLTTFQPDLVVLQEVWLYRYLSAVKRHKCRIILDEYNVEADLFQQIYRSVRDLRSQVKEKLLIPQLKAIEGDFIRQSDQVWVCSEKDASLLQQLYGQVSHIHFVPNGINVADYDSVRSGECSPPNGLEETRRNILFLGQFAYSPNSVAAQLLISEIYPRLRQIYPDCRLLLVGRNPTQPMLEAAKRDSQIIVTGEVPDVRPYLAAASVTIVPLLQGGGTRLKILEAFAAGCPTVSTAKGAEGLKARDGEHLLIRNSIEELVAGVCQLWSDQAMAAKLADNAYQLVRAEYSWEAVRQRLEGAIFPLLDGRIS
jgi:glycosyltransferase involved in cell wall biosynthesis